jgi:DmsE family decaheme c-type cytochrome
MRAVRSSTPILAALILVLAAAAARDARAGGAAAPGTAPPTPAYSPQGADTCLGCHASNPTVMAIFRTKHARPGDPRGPFGHGGLQCEACHGPGGAHVDAMGDTTKIIAFGPKSHSSVQQQNENCLGCHRSNAAHDWASSAHAASDVACTSCHRLHAAKDPVQTAAGQIEVCAGCHQAEHADLDKLSRHPLREGKMACTSCHSPHGSTAPAQLVRNTVNETCTSCHAEYRGPFLWEHQPVTEDCTNCHDPHGSAQPALLKMRPPFLCQTCHEGAGHPSIVNTPQGLAGGGAPSAFLLAGGCINCHSQIHGSNHPSGRAFMR